MTNAESDTFRAVSRMLAVRLLEHFPSEISTGRVIWMKEIIYEPAPSYPTQLESEAAICHLLKAAFKAAYNLDVGIKSANKYVIRMEDMGVMSSTALALMQADPELVATAVLPPLAWVVLFGSIVPRGVRSVSPYIVMALRHE